MPDTRRQAVSGIDPDPMNRWIRNLVEIPLRLPPGPCWEVARGPVDGAAFLRALAPAFPEATHAYFEGSSIAPDVARIFAAHADAGPYLPSPQTIWSSGRNQRLRCRFTAALFDALAEACGHHAEMELFDHVFVYAGDQAILEWPDAFGNCMWIAPAIDEARVDGFARRLGLGYKALGRR